MVFTLEVVVAVSVLTCLIAAATYLIDKGADNQERQEAVSPDTAD